MFPHSCCKCHTSPVPLSLSALQEIACIFLVLGWSFPPINFYEILIPAAIKIENWSEKIVVMYDQLRDVGS